MLSRPTTTVIALVPAVLVAFATASPVLASPFPNPDGTDSMDASKIERGKSTLDLRVDGSLPTSGLSQGQGLFNVNYFGGLIDGVELGGGVNANAPFGALAGATPID